MHVALAGDAVDLVPVWWSMSTRQGGPRTQESELRFFVQ